MKVNEVRSVEARVGINVAMEILKQQILAGEKQTVVGSLRISSSMIATLSGAGFKITATTPEQQTVAEGFPTVWEWNTEAIQEGDQKLTATLTRWSLTGTKQIAIVSKAIREILRSPLGNRRGMNG